MWSHSHTTTHTHTIWSKFMEGRVTLSPMSQVMPSLKNVLNLWQITERLSALIRSAMYNMLLCYTTEFKGHLNTGNKLLKMKSPRHASFNTQIMCTWPTWEWAQEFSSSFQLTHFTELRNHIIFSYMAILQVYSKGK